MISVISLKLDVVVFCLVTGWLCEPHALCSSESSTGRDALSKRRDSLHSVSLRKKSVA